MQAAFRKFETQLKKLNVREGLELYFWSDGGLRNYGTLAALWELSKRIQHGITMEFLPSYHGHSRCDAHFGRGKIALRKTYPSGGLNSVGQVMHVFRLLKN